MSTSSDRSSVVLTLSYTIRPDPSNNGNHNLHGAVGFTADGTLTSRLTADEHEAYERSFPREYEQASHLANIIAENLQRRAAAAAAMAVGEDTTSTSTSTSLTPEWLEELVYDELQTARTVAEQRGTAFGQISAVRVTPDEFGALQGQEREGGTFSQVRPAPTPVGS